MSLFENFPYTNFHDLNLDWIIKIAKDFLDQYTHIQEVIQTGLTDISTLTDEGKAAIESLTTEDLAALEAKKVEIEGLLNAWYDTHSAEIASQLANAISSFDSHAYAKAAEVIASIPLDYTNLATQVNDLVDNGFTGISKYLYKENKYINASGEETTEDGFNLYRIPYRGLYGGMTAIILQWNAATPFYANLTKTFVFDNIDASENVTSILSGAGNVGYIWDMSNTYPRGLFMNVGGYSYLSVCAKAELADTIKVAIVGAEIEDRRINACLGKNNVVYPINWQSAVGSRYYMRASTGGGYWFSGNERSYICAVHQGDVIKYPTNTAFDYVGELIKNDGTIITTDNSGTFTVPADGIFIAFGENPDISYCTLYPKDSAKLEAKNIVGLDGYVNPYSGRAGVAFGTSITYRAITHYGYLQYLPDLLDMTFDNQGVSNGVLSDSQFPSIYDKITTYADYANMDVCIVEGFVNDWYSMQTLGLYTDNDDSSCCGRLRQALTHILTQNPHITVILVLDHYGRNYNQYEEGSTAIRNGLTQYQYYNELAKVAESLSIPVIKLYEVSEMNEYTSFYYADDIHPNQTGAEHTATVIANCMKQIMPKD